MLEQVHNHLSGFMSWIFSSLPSFPKDKSSASKEITEKNILIEILKRGELSRKGKKLIFKYDKKQIIFKTENDFKTFLKRNQEADIWEIKDWETNKKCWYYYAWSEFRKYENKEDLFEAIADGTEASVFGIKYIGNFSSNSSEKSSKSDPVEILSYYRFSPGIFHHNIEEITREKAMEAIEKKEKSKQVQQEMLATFALVSTVAQPITALATLVTQSSKNIVPSLVNGVTASDFNRLFFSSPYISVVNRLGLAATSFSLSKSRVNRLFSVSITLELFSQNNLFVDAAFPATWDLSTLESPYGVTFQGRTGGRLAGASSVGDINRDDYSDFMIGVPSASPLGRSAAGEAWLFWGRPGIWPSVIDLNTFNETSNNLGAVLFQGPSAGYSIGSTFSSAAGDVNGDGYPDIAFGSSANNRVIVVFGRAGGWPSVIDLNKLNKTTGVIFQGRNSGDLFGSAIGISGDINHDNITDLIVGARDASPLGRGNAGEVYVIFGGRDWPYVFDLNLLNVTTGIIFQGISGNLASSTIQDVNKDGFPDMLMNAPAISLNGYMRNGVVYFIRGRQEPWPSVVDLNTLNSTVMTSFFGACSGGSGTQFCHTSMTSGRAGADVNGDGYIDLLFSAPAANTPGDDSGESYILFGGSTSWATAFALNPSSFNGITTGLSIEGKVASDVSGGISSIGDFNADNFEDVVIGAPGANSAAGEVYLFFGHGGQWPSPFWLTSLTNGTTGIVFPGKVGGDNLAGPSSAGDVNGDGFSDLILVAGGADPQGRINVGEAYLIFGRSSDGQAPVVIGQNAAIYVENSPPVLINPGINVADFDSPNLVNGTVTISQNFIAAEDTLVFSSQNGIIGSYNNSVGVLRLSGLASILNYRAALRSVAYLNLSEKPGNRTRTVAFEVSDGTYQSDVVLCSVSVYPVEDKPVLGGQANLTYVENSDEVLLNSAVTVTDADTDSASGFLTNATICICESFDPLWDKLRYVDQRGIIGSFDNQTGILFIRGIATLADYQMALRNITYINESDEPATPARLIVYRIYNGLAETSSMSFWLSIVSVNDRPVLFGSTSATYNYGGLPVVINSLISIVDKDNREITSATISITDGLESPGDILGFSTVVGISANYNSLTGVLQLTGSSSLQNYQSFLREVNYVSQSPPSKLSKKVQFRVSDGADDSNVIDSEIDVFAPDSSPNNNLGIGLGVFFALCCSGVVACGVAGYVFRRKLQKIYEQKFGRTYEGDGVIEMGRGMVFRGPKKTEFEALLETYDRYDDFYLLSTVNSVVAKKIKDNMGYQFSIPDGSSQVSGVIGFGQFGETMFAYDSKTGQFVLCKIVKGERACENSRAEAEIHQKVSGKLNVIKLIRYGDFTQQSNIRYVHFLEYANFGNGDNLVSKLGQIRQADIKLKLLADIIKQLLTGLTTLQEECVYHADLKTSNIVVTLKPSLDDAVDIEIKIIDFGCSQYLPSGRVVDNDLGDSGVFSLQRINYHKSKYAGYKQSFDAHKEDLWATGLIAYELLTGKDPKDVFKPSQLLRNADQNQVNESVFENRKKELDGLFSPEKDSAENITAEMLTSDADRRPSAKVLLRYDFFRKQQFVSSIERTQAIDVLRTGGISNQLPVRQEPKPILYYANGIKDYEKRRTLFYTDGSPVVVPSVDAIDAETAPRSQQKRGVN